MATVSWIEDADVTANLRFSEPKTIANGMKLLELSYGGKSVLIQTPLLLAPFGANDKFEPGKFKLMLRLAAARDHAKARLDQFLSLIRSIEEAVILHVWKNQESILGSSDKALEIITDRYSPLIKKGKGNYEDALNLLVKQDAMVFDFATKTQKDRDYITRNSHNTVLFQLGSIWVSSKGFGLSATVLQALVTPSTEQKISSFMIVPEVVL
jgi:hypothetical protein